MNGADNSEISRVGGGCLDSYWLLHPLILLMIVPLRQFLINSRLGQRIYLYAVGGETKNRDQSSCSHSYALSLLPELPTTSVLDSATNSPLIFAWSTSDEPARHPEACQEAPVFVELMHTTIGRAHEQLHYLLASRAVRQGEGWLALVDERAPFTWGRTPEAEDTIGFCRVERGRVQIDSYEPMPAYRLITHAGIFSLPAPLHQRLIEQLERSINR